MATYDLSARHFLSHRRHRICRLAGEYFEYQRAHFQQVFNLKRRKGSTS